MFDLPSTNSVIGPCCDGSQTEQSDYARNHSEFVESTRNGEYTDSDLRLGHENG